MQTRRGFLKQAVVATASAPMFLSGHSLFAAGSEKFYVSACSDDQKGMHLVGFDSSGVLLFENDLPGRAHAITARPNHSQIAAFARRPGRFIQIVDPVTGKKQRELQSPSGRHFYGHGVYSPDGRILFTAENNYVEEDGVIGLWNAEEDYRRIGEYSAQGIGPHELSFMPDGESLAIAVGGILTHPDEGRAKLNIPEMSPALVYLNAETGQLISRHQLPLNMHKLSIRHLDVNASGILCFGLQNEGSRRDYPALVGFHRPGEELRLLDAPYEIWQGMKNYCGSVAFDRSGKFVAASSPRGNMISFWDVRTGQHLYASKAEDGCGLAAGEREGEFIVTCGTGEVLSMNPLIPETLTIKTAASSGRHWDNHLLAIG